MAVRLNILYHWTHRDNIDSIEATGLDPDYATGELHAVWGCDRTRREWAQDHVASKHKWNAADLVLLRIHAANVRCYRTCWEGVYYTPTPLPSNQIEVVGPGGEVFTIRDWCRAAFVPLVDQA